MILVTIHGPKNSQIYNFQRFYIATARQLKRIDAVRRSPVYSHFGESVAGASSVRGYGKRDDFIKKSDELNDQNNMAFYANAMASR